MPEYEPIGEFVKSISDSAWDALAEIHKRRPAIMLGELLAVAERKRGAQREPERRQPRSLANHPDSLRMR